MNTRSLLACALLGERFDLRNIFQQLLCFFRRDQVSHDDLLVVDRSHNLAGLIMKRAQDIALPPNRASRGRIHELRTHHFANTTVSIGNIITNAVQSGTPFIRLIATIHGLWGSSRSTGLF